MSQITTTTTPIIPQTRQKTAMTATKKMQKDSDNASSLNTDVRLKEQATEFLIAKEYIVHGKPVNLQTLSHILFQFRYTAIRLPKALTDRIRAVVFLLEDASAQHMADMITATIKSQLKECIEAFTTKVETMRDVVEHVWWQQKTSKERLLTSMKDLNAFKKLQTSLCMLHTN
jgi:hypothetical protein